MNQVIIILIVFFFIIIIRNKKYYHQTPNQFKNNFCHTTKMYLLFIQFFSIHKIVYKVY